MTSLQVANILGNHLSNVYCIVVLLLVKGGGNDSSLRSPVGSQLAMTGCPDLPLPVLLPLRMCPPWGRLLLPVAGWRLNLGRKPGCSLGS